MSASEQVYLKQCSIPVVFDTLDPKQARSYEAFKNSFGHRHAIPEDLDPPYRRSLALLPGGLREVQR